MRKLGQHFLKNTAILDAIVLAIAPVDSDHIIEIGPGHGELTVPLLRAARGKQCEIVCVEKDRTLIDGLRALLSKEGFAGAGVQEGDALKLLPSIIRGAAYYKIAGNIPYYITGKLLRVISELENKPERVVLLIQKEVAERVCADPPAMNRLAASVQFWANTTIVVRVPRHNFSPPPEVDSAVIVLERKSAKEMPAIDPALYYRAVRAIFAQPRKTILNNVASAIAKTSGQRDDFLKMFQTMGIDPKGRPQTLAIGQIAVMAKELPWG